MKTTRRILPILLWIAVLSPALAQNLKKHPSQQQLPYPISKETLHKVKPIGPAVPPAKSSFFTQSQWNPLGYHARNSSQQPGLKPLAFHENGTPSWIRVNPEEFTPQGNSRREEAAQVLEATNKLWAIGGGESNFEVLAEETDELQQTHIRYQQVYQGIPVFGAEIIAHRNERGWYLVNGLAYPSPKEPLAREPQYSEAQAIAQAKGLLKQKGLDFRSLGAQELKLVDGEQVQVRLVWYPVGARSTQFQLAWHVLLLPDLINHWEFFIDAQRGAVLNEYNSICRFHNHGGEAVAAAAIEATELNTAETQALSAPPTDGKTTANATDLNNVSRLINTYNVGSSYYLVDASRAMFKQSQSVMPNEPVGVIWTINAMNTSPENDNFNYDHVSSSNNAWSNKTSVSAHYNGGVAYEYFKNQHARESINGKGGNIISLINVAESNGGGMDNAFWNGSAMFYGNGATAFQPLAKGLDVAGHEMSHGVIQNTANLTYQGESGALNESFADIFGALIDSEDWLMGEDVVKLTAFPSGALRSLQDPHNGGTKLSDPGYQPRIYSERYTGTQDNGGVHINSGIANWAFFKFTNKLSGADLNAKKTKAGKIYYLALSKYLTKSSKFIDARNAVIQAASDLFGAASAEVSAAKDAWAEVGIGEGSGGDYQDDINTNPGQDYVFEVRNSDGKLFVSTNTGTNPQLVSNTIPYSRPSVSDNGQYTVFVGSDKKIHLITIDWSTGDVAEEIIQDEPIWRNVALSKDGSKIAGVDDSEENIIWVYSFDIAAWQDFELYNPTFSNEQTDDVKYADALEFDLSSEYLVYDAYSEITKSGGGSISYWDVGFMHVWDNGAGDFSDGYIEKLFAGLPENTSVGNPSFSKNSPYIVAYDFVDYNDESYALEIANVETGKYGQIFLNAELNFPNFSKLDDKVIFNATTNGGTKVIGVRNLSNDKLSPVGDAAVFISGFQYGVWFSTGERVLSGTKDKAQDLGARIFPNPAGDLIQVEYSGKQAFAGQIRVIDISGKSVLTQRIDILTGPNRFGVNLSDLPAGSYWLQLLTDQGVQSSPFVKY